MKRRGAGCIDIEADLVAAAIGEADTVAEGRVVQHVAKCESCRNEHSSYQAIDRELGVMRQAPVDPQGVAQSRERLEARLDDIRSRIVIDSVADKGLFHKNKAARDKSRLSAKVKALAGAAA